MKVVIYADTVREARKFYTPKPCETVAYRIASDFTKPEKADLVLYAREYPEIEKAYQNKKEKVKK